MPVPGPPPSALNATELAEVIDSIWTLVCSILVMLLQPGFALLETGYLQELNLACATTQHVLVLTIGAFAWLLFGSPIAVRGDGVEANLADEEQVSSLFGLLLCLTTVTISLRGMVGRATVWADVVMALATSILLYPMAVRWTSGGGWLEELDAPFHAGAGAARLHVVGGVAATVGARLGQRQQTEDHRKRKKRRNQREHRGPLVVAGTLVTWVGWHGFGVLCTGGMRTKRQALIAARVAVNTTLAGISGGLLGLGLRTGFLRSAWRRLVPYPAQGEERPNTAASDLGPAAFSFGAISGLVAISGGSDCVENCTAMAIGALGSVAAALGARLLKVIRVDDPVEAGAVHGCAGAVGSISVGLFHRHKGLFVGGGWGLLGSQSIGVLAIGSFTAASSFALLKALRCLGVLGPPKQRQREELSLEAFQEYLEILEHHEMHVEDTIEALAKLRGVIWRPFSPQAGNNKIQGEVLDVLNLMSAAVKADSEYLAFISHYKVEAGDAARIIYDHLSKAVLAQAGLRSDEPRSSPSTSRKRSSARNVVGRLMRSRTEPELESKMTRTPSMAKEAKEPPELADEANLDPTGSASSSTRQVVPEGASSSTTKWRNLVKGAGGADGPRFDMERLFFLDSVDLRDLDELLEAVRRSSNFIILLTNGVLTRPWVLSELTVAVAKQKNIVAVRMEWPCKDDEKHFVFPDCIDEVMQQLEHCRDEMRRHSRSSWPKAGMRRVASRLSMRGSSFSDVTDRALPRDAHSSVKHHRSSESDSSPERSRRSQQIPFTGLVPEDDRAPERETEDERRSCPQTSDNSTARSLTYFPSAGAASSASTD